MSVKTTTVRKSKKNVGKRTNTATTPKLLEELDLKAWLRGGTRVPASLLDKEMPGWRAAAVRLQAKGIVVIRREGASNNESVSLAKFKVWNQTTMSCG